MTAALRDDVAGGWQARLELGFAPVAARTALVHSAHRGPLRVQRPFHPEADGSCHVYLLHPPGGVVGGDGLALDVQLAPGARALLTTPSASRFYRSAGARALQRQVLRIGAGARLDWLPQETIVFDGARLASTTRLELAGDAAACAWEIVCLGRPAAGEGWTHGEARFGFELWRDGRPLLLEHTPCRPGSALARAAWGLGGHVTFATLVATGACSERLARLRAALGSADRLGLTHCDDLLVARYRGPDAAEARRLFTAIWRDWRTAAGGEAPAPPRVWAT